jgi:hypothetical protein
VYAERQSGTEAHVADTTYSGSCQCQAVAFSAALDLTSSMTCNCSRCQRLGWVMAFAPAVKFTLKSGEDSLSQYTFNKEAIRHQFCRTCGIEPFAFAKGRDGSDMVAVNVNCLEGVDPRALSSKHADGRSL